MENQEEVNISNSVDESCLKRKKVEESSKDLFNGETREFYMVKHFTKEALPNLIPDQPVKMDTKAVKFIVEMILSECTELVQTLEPNREKAIEFVKNCLGVDVKPKPLPSDEEELIADQADALIDVIVYSQNALVKMGVDGYPLFKEVMESNINKRGPDGKFTIRESDGKIEKPLDWEKLYAPNIRKLIKEQMKKN